MFFTWKLSRKNEKFPANLIFSQINCYLILATLTFIIQTSYRNNSFEKIGFLISIVVNYYSILTNFVYFISVIYLLIIDTNRNCKNQIFCISKISKFEKTVNFYHDLIHKIFIILTIALYFTFNIPLKNCFIGGCLIDNSLKYYILILPHKIEEILILSCLTVVFFLYLSVKRISFLNFFFKDNSINKLEKDFTNINGKETNTPIEIDVEQNDCIINTEIHINNLKNNYDDNENNKRDYNKNLNKNNSNLKFFTGNSIWDEIKIIIIYEILYFVYIFIDTSIRYFKIVKIVDYRFDDYCSIHDYNLVIKSVILFLFLGINSKNIDQWKQAFTGEVEIDDFDTERKVNEILITRSKIFNNYIKYKT